jgi:hypothetical protein
VEGEIRNLALTHRLDEFQLAIPWRVAPQQSPSPLHQLQELCNSKSVGSNDPAKPKTVRLDFYVRQRIIVRLDFYVRQHDVFVVGYGMDYQQKYRNLPDIAILRQH